MKGFIKEVDMINLPAEKYWSFPKTYKGNAKKETKDFILSGNYLCSEKKDGHYARLIKDDEGNIILQGRSKSVNGEYLDKHEWVPQLNEFFDWLPAGTVLLGELFFPEKRGSRYITTILGCLKDKAIQRQEKGDKLYYYVFDVWAYNGENCLNKTMEQRVELLKEIELDWLNSEKANQTYTLFAEYLKGEEAWSELGSILNSGGEGMVITRADSKPEPGKRTARKTLKVKLEIEQTIDAFLDGQYEPPTKLYNGKTPETWKYWLNDKTGEKTTDNMYKNYCAGEPWIPITKAYFNGWAAAVSFSVLNDGKPVRIGWISGIDETLRNGIVNESDKWINKVAELTCMELEKSGNFYTMRHGKIKQWRKDKDWKDCEFNQIK